MHALQILVILTLTTTTMAALPPGYLPSFFSGPNCVNGIPPSLPPFSTISSSPLIQGALTKSDELANIVLAQLDTLPRTDPSSSLSFGFSIEMVVGSNSLFSRSYGSVNGSGTAPPTRDTIYRIGSVTKIFTSLLFASAIERGYTTWDTPLAAIYNEQNPPVFNTTNPWGKTAGPVTLGSLAAQISGLPREAFSCRLTSPCDEEDVFFALQNGPLMFPPMSTPHYSNLGLGLLGRAVARVWPGDLTYEELVEEVILQPLGMETGSFSAPADLEELIVGFDLVAQTGSDGKTTYSQTIDPYNTAEFGWINPAGGLYSSPRDMAKFMSGVLTAYNNEEGGSSFPLSSRMAREYVLPSSLFPGGKSGFGKYTFEQVYDGSAGWLATKDGLVGGYATQLVLIPDLNFGLTIQLNADSGVAPDGLGALIVSVIAPALQQVYNETAKANPPPLPPNVDELIGEYVYEGTTFLTLNLTADGKGLEGTMIGTGDEVLAFFFDPVYKPFAGDSTVLRFGPAGNIDFSCFGLYGGNLQGIAIFDESTVSLLDQGFFAIPKA